MILNDGEVDHLYRQVTHWLLYEGWRPYLFKEIDAD